MARELIACALLASAASAQQREEIREASPSEFVRLPAHVRRDLTRRGCTIPQPPHSKSLANAILGHFRNPRDLDWAVLCDIQRAKRNLLLVYGQGTARAVTVRRADLGFTGCLEEIGAVGKKEIMTYFHAFGGPKPPPIFHQGIDVGICEKASTIHYFYKGRWLQLTGAD